MFLFHPVTVSQASGNDGKGIAADPAAGKGKGWKLKKATANLGSWEKSDDEEDSLNHQEDYDSDAPQSDPPISEWGDFEAKEHAKLDKADLELRMRSTSLTAIEHDALLLRCLCLSF